MFFLWLVGEKQVDNPEPNRTEPSCRYQNQELRETEPPVGLKSFQLNFSCRFQKAPCFPGKPVGSDSVRSAPKFREK